MAVRVTGFSCAGWLGVVVDAAAHSAAAPVLLEVPVLRAVLLVVRWCAAVAVEVPVIGLCSASTCGRRGRPGSASTCGRRRSTCGRRGSTCSASTRSGRRRGACGSRRSTCRRRGSPCGAGACVPVALIGSFAHCHCSPRQAPKTISGASPTAEQKWRQAFWPKPRRT